jgi:hypothetical protein
MSPRLEGFFNTKRKGNTMNIEDTIFDRLLPVNTKATLNRLNKLLDEHQTNSLIGCKYDPRIKRLIWLLNSQIYGQMATIDMEAEWQSLNVKQNIKKQEIS